MTETTETQQKVGKTSGFLILAAIIGLGAWASVSESQKNYKKTLQDIVKERLPNAGFHVQEVYVPFAQAVYGSEFLTSMGIISGKSGGHFTISADKPKTLNSNCSLNSFDYTISQAGSASRSIFISGEELTELQGCQAF
jgi:hypothetical protein